MGLGLGVDGGLWLSVTWKKGGLVWWLIALQMLETDCLSFFCTHYTL